MSRYAAHLYPSSAGDRARCQMQPQQLGGGLGILAVHFKEVSHLKQYNIVWVAFFDRVIGKVGGQLVGECFRLIRRRNGKSGGRNLLRFCDPCNLFCLRWEQGKLFCLLRLAEKV